MSTFGLRSEIKIEERMSDFLKKFVDKKFHGVTIKGIERQYERGLEGRRADIAVIKDDDLPLMIIETKKKYEVRGFRAERRFIATSDEVLGQVFAYAALLKRNGIHVPFVATANESQIAVFEVPEDIDKHVDWKAVEGREYGRVLPKDYIYEVLKAKHLILHEQLKFSDDFFARVLDTVTGLFAKKYSVEEKRLELHWVLIEDLRGFVDFLTSFVRDAIAPNNAYRSDIAKLVEEYAKSRGYKPEPGQLAREMAYVLMNKIVFYKVLEHHYKFERRLEPLYSRGAARSVSEYLRKLNELFEYAVQETGDFEAIFRTGIYDKIDAVESEEVLSAFDWLIGLIDRYSIEKFGDIIGHVYEDLIPAEERHTLGQFYTPKPVAELITRWAVRSPDDKVLDPGCGSGTFLVEAYKRLAELKLKRPFSEAKYVPSDVHAQILGQLVGVDINEFPAHLTAMNLAMRNPKVPSSNINVVVADFFSIVPGQRTLLPHKVRTTEGERVSEIVLKDFNAVVGNPPYTRWGELPENTQRNVIGRIGDILQRYDLLPQAGRRGAEYTMVVFWLIHSTNFIKEGGRLGMIISDSWLQTSYGIRFGRYLADHYKIHAIIDISARVFPVPLIGTCIVLLEKCSKPEERDANDAVFAYLDVKTGSIDVDKVLEIVNRKQPGIFDIYGSKIIVKVYKQRTVKESDITWINFIFNTNEVLEKLATSDKVIKLSEYFEPSYGNILYTYLYTKGIVKTRHAGIGGKEFFYLTVDDVNQHRLPNEYVYPLLPSARYTKFFTFTRNDWQNICKEGGECYLFLAHKPRNELPREVLNYIKLGESQIVLRKGIHKGEPVSSSRAAEERKKHRGYFYDWYDLCGVLSTLIFVPRYARYFHRFTLIEHGFNVAIDEDFIALIAKQGVQFNDIAELKALLAYLNSSFIQLYIESKGRVPGGVGPSALEVKQANEMPILDVKKLPRDVVEKLAKLFDKLEEEARRLGGADSVENVFGSELAEELTGKDVRPDVKGLFNTVLKDIDYEVARILGLEDLVEAVRLLVLDMVRRRLARAGEAEPSALRGSEEVAELRKPKKGRKSKSEGSIGMTRRLDEWMGER